MVDVTGNFDGTSRTIYHDNCQRLDTSGYSGRLWVCSNNIFDTGFITVTYEDSDGTIDLVVGTLNQDTTETDARRSDRNTQYHSWSCHRIIS